MPHRRRPHRQRRPEALTPLAKALLTDELRRATGRPDAEPPWVQRSDQPSQPWLGALWANRMLLAVTFAAALVLGAIIATPEPLPDHGDDQATAPDDRPLRATAEQTTTPATGPAAAAGPEARRGTWTGAAPTLTLLLVAAGAVVSVAAFMTVMGFIAVVL